MIEQRRGGWHVLNKERRILAGPFPRWEQAESWRKGWERNRGLRKR
jgi:hypothetical protein